MKRIQFAKYGKLVRRKDKIAALSESKTPEAKAARRKMNEFKIRQGRTNVNGFFGVQRITRRTKKKERGIKMSPQMRLALSGKL